MPWSVPERSGAGLGRAWDDACRRGPAGTQTDPRPPRDAVVVARRDRTRRRPMTTSTTTATVPQARFPGQAAAPPGPADLLPMYLMHHAFRRDLAAFAAAVGVTDVQDGRAWRRLARRWGRFARILHLHHAGEDEILWPLLLRKVDAGGDATGRATLEAMEAEHEEIDPLLAGCADGLAELAA